MSDPEQPNDPGQPNDPQQPDNAAQTGGAKRTADAGGPTTPDPRQPAPNSADPRQQPTPQSTVDRGSAPDAAGQNSPPIEGPAVEPPTPEIQWGGVSDATARLPGGRREYTKFPTGPVQTPALPGLHPDFEWTPDPAPSPQHGFLSPWALAFSALALLASLFVGWGFPLALGGIVTAIIALRRPLENRPAAIWAIVLGGVSLLYSGGWLFWAATRAHLITVPIVP